MILKLGLISPLLCYGEVAQLKKNVPLFWSNYNLDLRSYGQLLSLFDFNVKAKFFTSVYQTFDLISI